MCENVRLLCIFSTPTLLSLLLWSLFIVHGVFHQHTQTCRCPYTVSGEHEPNVILKDNDIKYKIRLPRNTTENLLTQIRADAEFLHSIGVMDYSLLGTCRDHN